MADSNHAELIQDLVDLTGADPKTVSSPPSPSAYPWSDTDPVCRPITFLKHTNGIWMLLLMPTSQCKEKSNMTSLKMKLNPNPNHTQALEL